MKGLGNILGNFDTIGLSEMDSVKLMSRKEIKYVLSGSDLELLLNKLEDEYYIVEIKDKKIIPYKTRYYDLPEFNLYTVHQNGKLNRFKVRSRTYALTGTTFIEYKFKTNKKRTIKDRIEIDEDYKFSDCYDFLNSRLPFEPSQLEEKMQINYNRITLVDKKFSARVTIDTNLKFRNTYVESSFDNLSIIEIKKEVNGKPAAVERVLKEMGLHPFSISKYCLGISQLYTGVKKNLINIKIREINKLLYESDSQFQKKII